jgi:hypothetical protein
MIIIILGLEFWFGGKNSEVLKHITTNTTVTQSTKNKK